MLSSSSTPTARATTLAPLCRALNEGAIEISQAESRNQGLARIGLALNTVATPPPSLPTTDPLTSAEEFNVVHYLGNTREPLDVNKPFLFPFVIESITASPRFTSVVCGIASYNMAVGYHSQALTCETFKERQGLLHRAKTWYLQAVTLIEQEDVLMQPDGDLVYVHLATSCNLMHLLRRLGQPGAASEAARWQDSFTQTFIFATAEAHECPVYRYFDVIASDAQDEAMMDDEEDHHDGDTEATTAAAA